jgi:hypothetical protein
MAIVGNNSSLPLEQAPRFSTHTGVFQNRHARLVICLIPAEDFIQRPEAAETDIIVAQAAIPDTWRLHIFVSVAQGFKSIICSRPA